MFHMTTVESADTLRKYCVDESFLDQLISKMSDVCTFDHSLYGTGFNNGIRSYSVPDEIRSFSIAGKFSGV